MTKETYTAQDIEVLEGLEPVRRRPGMYIGGTDEKALHHLVAELLDNSMDEAVAGHARQISMILGSENEVTILDDGRGIPIDPHPKFPDKSALEVILTTLHSGGKFSQKNYATSGGLHGVGLSVVNALSQKLVVEVTRGGKVWQQTYVRGDPTTTLQSIGKSEGKGTGTKITFSPDPEIFKGGETFDPRILLKMVRLKATLHKGVHIHWHCADALAEKFEVPTQATFYFPGGLLDLLHHELKERETFPIFSGEAQFPNSQGRLEWALTWDPEADEGNLRSFCNTIPTPLGGTHETGLKNALLRSIRSYGELTKNKRVAQITTEDVLCGLQGLLSVFVREPEFQGQTKEKLASSSATRLVENAFKDHFEHWLTEDPTRTEDVLAFFLERLDERLARKAQKEMPRKSLTRRLRLPGKLTDCSRSDAQGTEIFLLEGDSAAGSAKGARLRETQAILPLRGKILNVASATPEKLHANQEVQNIVQALGCGAGKHYRQADLRYEKVIIMTDADVDGAHIATLLMTFFFLEMRPLVANGHLYLASPPLYRLATKDKTVYVHSDDEKEHALKTLFKPNAKVDISRFKGLGEMMAHDLKKTTMDPKERTLLQISLEELEGSESIADFVERLMGRRAEQRYLFIQENAVFAEDLDI